MREKTIKLEHIFTPSNFGIDIVRPTCQSSTAFNFVTKAESLSEQHEYIYVLHNSVNNLAYFYTYLTKQSSASKETIFLLFITSA